MFASADALRAGDVVEYQGELHRIVRVLLDAGWAWPVAVAEGGWAIALGRTPINVMPRTRSGKTALTPSGHGTLADRNGDVPAD